MPTTEERMETLEKQVRRQRRWNIALGVVVIFGGLMAAQSATNKQSDKPMKVELVGPIKVDGVGAIVTHTVNWDGIGSLPVNVKGSVDVDATVSPSQFGTFRIRQN